MAHYLDRHISTEMSELAPIHDELPFWSSRFGSLLFDHLEVRPRVHGLDLACGTGFPLIELALVHGPSSRFVGVDLWEEALDIARRKIEIHRLSNVDVQHADCLTLPFPDDSFELITSNLGFNNFADPQSAMSEAFRVACPGARLALTTNPTGTMPEVYEILKAVLHDVAPDSLAALEVEERHRGTVDSVAEVVGNAGFSVTRRISGEFSMPFADGAALFGHTLCAWFLEGWRTVIDESVIREVFERAERRITENADPRLGFRTTVRTLYLEAEKP